MRGFSSSVLSCVERERLEEELHEVRTRGAVSYPAAAADFAGTSGAGSARAGSADAAEGPRRGAWLRAVMCF
jgi:hypothetical protein